MDPMDAGNFFGGLLNLANWAGNVILPTVAVLILALAIYNYGHGRGGERYVIGAMAALCVSGLLRLAETFVGTTASADQYYRGVLNLCNWVGNVILPVYAGLEIVRAVIALRVSNLQGRQHDLWLRHFITAGACLCVSALIRLLEYFIANGHAIGG